MNRARISLLVAAAVIVGAPTLASAQDNQDHREHQGGDRGGRGAPPPVQDRRSQPAPQQQAPAPRQEAPRQAPPQQQQQQFQQQRPPAGQGYGDRHMPDGRPGRGGQGQFQQQQPPPVQQGQQNYPDRRFNNGGDRPDNRGGYDGRRDDPRGDGRNDGRGDYRGGDHRGAPPPNGYRGNDGRYGGGQGWQGGQQGRDYGRPGANRPAWRNDWRGDNRYNWRGWRDQNRQQFHAPRYVAPRGYGWGYRSFGIGYRLDSFFFAPNYWVNDPWDYRLPPVYGPYRWVRYYNDVLLVDIDTGEVVDVIQNFFW